jgi:hypothetical protein
MIFKDSRYVDGTLAEAYNPKTGIYHVTVFRKFPTSKTRFYLYTWNEEDRIDLIAHERLGHAALWWKIMDFNPEIINPMNIPVGTTIRIPNVS